VFAPTRGVTWVLVSIVFPLVLIVAVPAILLWIVSGPTILTRMLGRLFGQAGLLSYAVTLSTKTLDDLAHVPVPPKLKRPRYICGWILLINAMVAACVFGVVWVLGTPESSVRSACVAALLVLSTLLWSALANWLIVWPGQKRLQGVE